jgi:hypothetical protein
VLWTTASKFLPYVNVATAGTESWDECDPEPHTPTRAQLVVPCVRECSIVLLNVAPNQWVDALPPSDDLNPDKLSDHSWLRMPVKVTHMSAGIMLRISSMSLHSDATANTDMVVRIGSNRDNTAHGREASLP